MPVSPHRIGACAPAAMFVALVIVAGCDGNTNRSEIATQIQYPSAIDYDARTRRLLVGSYGNGAIEQIALHGEFRNREFAPAGDTVLRLRVDSVRRRLWVLGRGSVRVHDLDTAKLVAKVALPEWLDATHNCLPDMALDGDGSAVVSSNVAPALWRVNPRDFTVSRQTIELGNGLDFGFSALAFVGGRLVAAAANPGELWEIDLARSRGTRVQLTRRIHGACGLSPLAVTPRPGASNTRLYVAGGFHNGVKRVDLDLDGRTAAVFASSLGRHADVPIGLAFVARVLIIASSQLRTHPDYGGDGAPTLPFQLLEAMPL